MKKTKVFYYVSTALFSLSMLLGAYLELTQEKSGVELFRHLGYPLYLLYILGVAKILGVAAIWQNKWPLMREWAYAGFTIDLGGALASSLFVGDTGVALLPAILHLAVLAVSYVSLKKLKL